MVTYDVIYLLGVIGLIAVWPLFLIMLEAKPAPIGWVVRGCCALAIAFFALTWYLAYTGIGGLP
jgi:hypothetical protein